MIYRRQWVDRHCVCPWCEHHGQLTPYEWIELLLDPDSFVLRDADMEPAYSPCFANAQQSYHDKRMQARVNAGTNEALIAGSAMIGGLPLEIVIAKFAFLGSSLGAVVGERVACAAERAARQGVPLISINAAGGAGMYEGVIALMQMAKVSVALKALDEASQLHVSVLVDQCYGGVCACYASMADVVLAEPGAQIGCTGPRVIEQTTRQTVPADFQTAEVLLAGGMIDRVVPRSDLRATLQRLLRLHQPACRTGAACDE